jgi:hypothetical protein
LSYADGGQLLTAPQAWLLKPQGADMDWPIWICLALVAVYFLWRFSKDKEKAAAANVRLTKDNQLYQHIKAGVREYDWQKRNQEFKIHRDGELVFENAHLKVFNVSHFAETRIGFYFKDLDEYGLYGFFAGNGDEYFESYYRTDSTFKKEGRLLHDDD